MTFSTEPRSCLLTLPLSPPMATNTLTMESLSKVDSGLLVMTCRTTNVGISLLKFAFIQYVLPITVDVMAIRAGKVSGHVNAVRECHLGTLLFSVCVLIVDYDLLWLRPERSTDNSRQNGHQKQTLISHTHTAFPFEILCSVCDRKS